MEFFDPKEEVRFTEPEVPFEIHERAVARARKYLVAEFALLDAIMEVDQHRVFKRFGITHLTPYCIKKLRLSQEVAACFVRVARKSVSVPQLREAVRDGRITISAAKAVASVITPENQEIWIEKASTLTRSELEREMAAAFPRASKPEKAWAVNADRVRMEFELTHEEMEMFKRAQDLASRSLGHAASLAETQVMLLKLYLDKKDPVKKADRHRGRSVEKKVHARDRGQCQACMPDGNKCLSTKWVHLHHIKPRSEGGSHTAENLMTLCSAHHRMWHAKEAKCGKH